MGNRQLVRIFALMVVGLCPMVFLHIDGAYNRTECERMKTPKMLRSCCNVSMTDEIIRTCRKDILRKRPDLRKDKLTLKFCIAECEFKAKGYLQKAHEINLKAVAVDLRRRHNHDLDYAELLLRGFQQCEQIVKNQVETESWLQSTTQCNLLPGTLLACALEKVYENCPAHRWHATPPCQKMRSFLKTCDELDKEL